MVAGRARARLAAGALVAVSVVALGTALAQTGAADLPAGVKRVLDCRTLQADAPRLACYDAAVSELAKLLSTGQVVSVDQEQVAKVRKQAFGFKLPSLDIFPHGGAKAPEIEQVSGVVERAYTNGEGRWVLELDGGAVWAQIETDRLSYTPKKGSKVDIRKASLGTYFLKIDGHTAIRAKRIE